MRYTNRAIIVSQSRISEAEGRVSRQRKTVRQFENAGHPADNAVALLLVMEQSLLSMKRFLTTLERDLERSLRTAEKLPRLKAPLRNGGSAPPPIVDRLVVEARYCPTER